MQEDNPINSALLTAALEYAALGFAVFPCKPGTKEPLSAERLGFKHGHKDATTNPDRIRACWQRHPCANIGISMRASGLVAVDPDLYEPDCGWNDFIDGKLIPATWQQDTASGGKHIIFQAPANATFPAKLARHVDLKWDGYVVAAPSVFNGGHYRSNGLPPAQAPDWLLNASAFSESRSSTSQSLDWETDPDSGLVVDGRENYLTHLVYKAYAQNPDGSAQEIADAAWAEYLETADQRRPSDRATENASLKKAVHILKQHPTIKNGRLLRGVAPVPAPPELPSDVAVRQLDEHIDSFLGQLGWTTSRAEAMAMEIDTANCQMDDTPPRLLIAGAAGLGKSSRLLAALKATFSRMKEEEGDEYEPRPVWYLAPTIDLCQELAARYGEGGLVVRGRLHGHDKGLKPPCERPNDVQELTSAGITNIANSLCRTWIDQNGFRKLVECPFRDTCGYYAQFENAGPVEVYFMTHDHLFTSLSAELVARPHLLVIDESPLQKLISMRRGFAPADLETDGLGALIAAELRAGRDPRIALRAAGCTKASLRAHAKELDGEPPAINPSMTTAQIRSSLKSFKPPVLSRVLRKMADELTVEHAGIRCLSYSDNVTVKAEDGSTSKTERIWLHYRKNVRALRKALPVLVLDATGDASLLAPSFPGITQITVAARRNAHVLQTYGFTASMNKMNGAEARHRDEIAALLQKSAAKYPHGLLVTYKEAEQYILVPEGWASEHFGNLRGIDRHKDRTVIVVVGRLQVDQVQMEKMALSLHYDSEIPIALTGTYEKQPVGFNMRDGGRLGVNSDRHADAVVEAVRWQHTEAEIIQAIDRLRLVHREIKAVVCIVNEVPTSVVVDVVKPYRELVERSGQRGAGGGPAGKLRQAFDELGGALPMNAEWLALRFPELWTSPNAVKMALRDYKKRSGFADYKELFSGARPHSFPDRQRRGPPYIIWGTSVWTAKKAFRQMTETEPN